MNRFAPTALLSRETARLLLVGLCLATVQGAWAQSPDEEAGQLARIAVERQQAEEIFLQRQWQCSQRFAVTSCVDEARREYRSAVDALDREQEAIDSRRRRARADERLAIIKRKTDALASVRAQPEKPQQPPAEAKPARRDPGPSKAPADSAADKRRELELSAEAAAQRAKASERRRAQARQRQLEREASQPSRKAPASALPPRPAIPAASAPPR